MRKSIWFLGRSSRQPVDSLSRQVAKGKTLAFSLSKRQRFVIAVIILSLELFFSQHLLGKSGFFIVFFQAFFTVVLLFLSNYRDIKDNFTVYFFVLPFFYSLSFGLFYFLVPARFLSKIVLTTLYAVGLYSLFLSINIFTVASMRTIALLSSARTVSFIITLISYFFLTNVLFTFDFSAILTATLLFIYSFFFIGYSIWTFTLDRQFLAQGLWVFCLSLCLFELAFVLWFWPASPTILAIFLTGLLYIIVGLSHVWFDKRLFRSVLWEYIWVAVIVSSILFLFTSWRG